MEVKRTSGNQILKFPFMTMTTKAFRSYFVRW